MLNAERGDLERADGLLKESLALSREWGTKRDLSVVHNALGMLAISRGDIALATAMLEESLIDAARIRLDEATWREAWEKGRSMTLDQAVSHALEGSDDRTMEQS